MFMKYFDYANDSQLLLIERANIIFAHNQFHSMLLSDLQLLHCKNITHALVRTNLFFRKYITGCFFHIYSDCIEYKTE